MTKYWCGVVSREHIKFGEQGGFCQVCHGKRSPLARMAVGDGIVFYSPVFKFQGKEKCQSFTAIGTVVGEETYQFQMTPTFVPYRRDVAYQPCVDVPSTLYLINLVSLLGAVTGDINSVLVTLKLRPPTLCC